MLLFYLVVLIVAAVASTH